MESLKELYRIGRGPSSSHTMGPAKAASQFASRHPEAESFRVTLYGSLAATGKGHMTDIAIIDELQKVAPVEIIWEADTVLERHTNGMLYESLVGGEVTDKWLVFSVGGGKIVDENEINKPEKVYSLSTIHEILEWCRNEGCAFWEYVEMCEGPEIWDYLQEVWQTMCQSIENGLNHEGVLPGGLGVRRKAATYFVKAKGYTHSLNSRGNVYAYALAVSEENASGGIIVTAPTCGSSGVLPAVLYHLYKAHQFRDVRIIRALATAGLFGNVVKRNASISGAEVGCQGEVGVACAMAAAASCQLFGGTPNQIEYAAELALEHHLGLTCDPVCGLVQVPCIERNAIAAARALDANIYATFSDGIHGVSFDDVVEAMKQTGHDIPSLYKETAMGGLAKLKNKRK